MVRRSENVREWYNTMQRMVKESKTRVVQKTVMDSEKMDAWLVARERIGALYQYTNERQERPISVVSIDRNSMRMRKRANSECE